MAESKTFNNVSQATWDRLIAIGRDRHGTQFLANGDRHGRATTSTPFGRLVLDYERDPEQQTLKYTIVSKPMLVTNGVIWNGVENTIAGCRNDGDNV